jgi:hypothetical protein
MLEAEQGPEHVGVENVGVALLGLLPNRTGATLHACIVHRDVEATEPCDHPVNETTNLRFVADVRLHEFGFGAEAGQLRGQCLSGILPPTGHAHAMARPSKTQRCGPTDTRQRAGDQYD